MVTEFDVKPPAAPVALPDQKGTYLLFGSLAVKKELTVGRLGRLDFQPGFYGYVGSAFGPGGLAARLGRHLRPSLRRHWHLDYLKPWLQPVRVWFTTEPLPCEHQWAAALAVRPDLCAAVERFGCSDCLCLSHLFHFSSLPSRRILPDCQAVEKIVYGC